MGLFPEGLFNTGGEDTKLSFYPGVAPVGRTKAPAALGAFKKGTVGFETEAELKAAYELLVEVRARLKELGLWE